MQILDSYITSAPSIQNAIDIFKGEWASSFPGFLNFVDAGKSNLFEDCRVSWAAEKIGGLQGKTILELGPLEAGHTYMMEQLGAASIIAVEANQRAYLKCLIVKEILGLKRAHFLFGDCVEYLRNCQEKFDLCFASGVLYHMINPVELLALISKVSDRVFIWTHYYDAEVINSNPNIAHKFSGSETSEWDGFRHTLYRYEYKDALDSTGFCGGSKPYSHWMNREDILSCLKYFGFTDIEIEFENKEHQNGPSFGLLAFRNILQQSEERSLSKFASLEDLDKLRYQFQLFKMEILHWKTKFNETKTELEQTQFKLNANLAELEETQALLQANKAELEKKQTLLQANKAELERLIKELKNSENEVANIQKQLLILKQTIAAMQSSKFWKLRGQWIKLKKIFGWGGEEIL